MAEYEKLGAFYLGRPYDLEAGRRGEGLVLYDSRALVTHGVCFGMTGSGKTGLCTVLLEEAAIDGIPAIVIDPKGDLGNLLLTFPELRQQDLLPWIREEEAARAGMTPLEYATRQAERWRTGLAEWGQDAARIGRLKSAADFTIYTPGSEAGIPVSVLKSFGAPPPGLQEDREMFRERINAAVSALLALLGIESGPIQGREHILLANILGAAWKDGKDLDLGAMIHQIQTPPLTRVGALDLESFFPAGERFELAMRLNNLLASPGFEAWLAGEPLDIGRLLHTAQGKPRVSIFSIAHLSDTERMFFVSLLLNHVVSWMRQQPGTTSLRALLYMDEIVGYLPPVANPPSKQPMMTLLKQARAFGLGVLLATQNPVDLDYKALSNAGTWFIGKLQTVRDQARVLDGLEGAAAGAGAPLDRQVMQRTLAALGNRVFLLYNVHEDAPLIFETRWALSYLCGPLTRAQVKTLMAPRKAEAGAASPQPPASAVGTVRAGGRPAVPPGVPQAFVPVRSPAPAGAALFYLPVILGAAQVRFADSKSGVDRTRDLVFTAPVRDASVPLDWTEATEFRVAAAALEAEPHAEAGFADLPSPAAGVKNYRTWSRDFLNWLAASQKLDLYRCPALGILSRPGESERDFRIRLDQAAREERDRISEELRARYAPKLALLQERIRRAEQTAQREAEQAQAQKMQTAISIGATLLGAFLGRKALSRSTLGRASTAARSYTRGRKESEDVRRASETIEALRHELAELESQFQAELNSLSAKIEASSVPLETVAVRPRKPGIQVRLVTLAWTPYWRDAQGATLPAWE